MIKIAPSVLSADFCRLGEEIESIKSADYIHFDVMDGAFVPNISFGLPILRAIRKETDMTLDVHLMIEKPVKYAAKFARSGADIVVMHVESDEPQNIFEAINAVKQAGKRVGLALNPKTPAEAVIPYLDLLDLILVMTVEPGFGGQSFMADMLPKVEKIRDMIRKSGRDCELEVDGGINPDTAKLCVNAGANVLVAGSSVFNASDREKAINELRGNF